MPSFEDRVVLERQKVAVLEHQEKMSKRRSRSDKQAISPEALKKAREEVVRNSPEWKRMTSLSQNPDFLLALRMYWEKYAEKSGVIVNTSQVPLSISRILRFEFGTPKYEHEFRERAFEDSLRIKEYPLAEKFDYDDGVNCTHGFIELSYYVGDYFYQGKHENDPSEFRPYSDVFKIFFQKDEYPVKGDNSYSGSYGRMSLELTKAPTKLHYEIPRGLVVARNTEGKEHPYHGNDYYLPDNTYEALDQFWERMAREVV